MPALHSIMNSMFNEMGRVASSTLLRLLVAAILGGAIGLERQLRHKPAGLRTNMFICFGAAMFTLLSRQLAGSDADSSRIASQIIPGIGFIGAGSILHARGSVSGLTTASTLFVVAGIGMAVGGGLYVTAVFATILILIALAVLGKIEHNFAIKTVVTTFEATGTSAESMLREVNRILEDKNLTLRSVHLASDDAHVRLAFAVDAGIEDRNLLTLRLHESSVFSSVVTLGSTEHE